MNDLEYAKLILDIVPPSMRFIREQMRISARSQLTVPQFRILARLSRDQAGNGELADWMGVSPPTMSRMLRPLIKRKLVTRKIDQKNKRQIILGLTESGQEIYQQIRNEVLLKFSKKISSLGSKKKTDLSEGLAILQEVLQ